MSDLSTSVGQKLDIKHLLGDTLALSIDVTDSAGVDYVFTSYTAELIISSKSSGEVFYTFTSEITLSAGNIAINIPATSIALPVGGYRYALRLLNGVNVYTWLYGEFNLVQGV
jgi:hypothetical protein